MSNVHRFKPRPKAPPPRRRLPFGRSPWLPAVLVLIAALLLVLTGYGSAGAGIGALAVVLVGVWLLQRA